MCFNPAQLYGKPFFMGRGCILSTRSRVLRSVGFVCNASFSLMFQIVYFSLISLQGAIAIFSNLIYPRLELIQNESFPEHKKTSMYLFHRRTIKNNDAYCAGPIVHSPIGLPVAAGYDRAWTRAQNLQWHCIDHCATREAPQQSNFDNNTKKMTDKFEIRGYKDKTLDDAMMTISQKPREEFLKTKPKKKNKRNSLLV